MSNWAGNCLSGIKLSKEEQLTKLYDAFNTRNVDSVLAHFSKDIDWPNGMNGGRVIGEAAVREYWINQWTLISTVVEPVSFTRSGVNVNGGCGELMEKAGIRDSRNDSQSV